MLNPGVTINNPNPDKITIVRTDQQPAIEHHPILDGPRFSRIRPFTVTVKAADKAIHTITVLFDVVTKDGMKFQLGGAVYTMPPGVADIGRGRSCEFWPGGRLSKDIHGQPLVRTIRAAEMDVLEKAVSVTASVDYVQFEDGTTAGPDTQDTKGTLARAAANPTRRRGQ